MSKDVNSWYRREGLGLFTDFYELTMMAGYLKEGRANQQVAFDYFFRSLPPHAGFAVAAGLEPFLDYVENLRFEQADIDYLRSLGIFDESFFEYLLKFRPACNIRAVPEGSLVFPHEPLLQVTGSIFEAQLIETALLNMVNYQTLIATKAARVCLAASGDPVIEFGLRRAHGPDGGLSGTRAAYIGGCVSSSNVLAGKVYGIPVSGTHAHSWVMSFPSELESFRAFARNYPEKSVLLVDTYDTIQSGVTNAVTVFKEMRDQGYKFRPAIRLDSGDLAKLSKIAHKMIVEAGFDDPLIIASNDLDEDLIADLKRQGAKINAWGVGTHLITSYESPALSGVYKLVALRENDAWLPRIKITSNIEKATDPGLKRLVRYFGPDGNPLADVICMDGENWPSKGTIICRQRTHPHLNARIHNADSVRELMQPVIEKGRRLEPAPPIAEIRQRVIEQIEALPEEYKRLRNPERFRVLLSPDMGALKANMLQNPE